MRIIFFICLSAVLFSCKSSSKKNGNEKKADSTSVTISPVALTAEQIPASIKVNGKLQEAWQWTDKSGENILVISYVEPYDDKEKNESGEEGQSAELHASQYVKKEGNYELLWKIDDGEKSCPFDITCKFIKDATTVTDLDKDAVAETTIQYRLACRSDVSPSAMKLVMYEGSVKYFLTGLSWIRSSPEDSLTVTEKDANLETLPGYKKTEEEFMKTFGRYESEKGFAGAPPEFLAYARQQWMKFVKESFE
jgi:hypothetical protein